MGELKGRLKGSKWTELTESEGPQTEQLPQEALDPNEIDPEAAVLSIECQPPPRTVKRSAEQQIAD